MEGYPVTKDMSSSLRDATERVSCEGDHLGPSSPLKQATQLTSNTLQSKQALTLIF